MFEFNRAGSLARHKNSVASDDIRKGCWGYPFFLGHTLGLGYKHGDLEIGLTAGKMVLVND